MGPPARCATATLECKSVLSLPDLRISNRRGRWPWFMLIGARRALQAGLTHTTWQRRRHVARLGSIINGKCPTDSPSACKLLRVTHLAQSSNYRRPYKSGKMERWQCTTHREALERLERGPAAFHSYHHQFQHTILDVSPLQIWQ
jgi:hypothetical protein